MHTVCIHADEPRSAGVGAAVVQPSASTGQASTCWYGAVNTFYTWARCSATVSRAFSTTAQRRTLQPTFATMPSVQHTNSKVCVNQLCTTAHLSRKFLGERTPGLRTSLCRARPALMHNGMRSTQTAQPSRGLFPRCCRARLAAHHCLCRAEKGQQQGQQQELPKGQEQGQTEQPPTGLGELTSQADIPEEDFWEGDRWNWLGTSFTFLIPALAVLALIVASFAASTYNEGADSYLVTPTEERPAQIIKSGS